MANEFQISSLTELFDSFGDSTLYKLPTATKVWCIWRDNDCRTAESEQYNFFQNSNLRRCNKYGIGSVWQKYGNGLTLSLPVISEQGPENHYFMMSVLVSSSQTGLRRSWRYLTRSVRTPSTSAWPRCRLRAPSERPYSKWTAPS